MVNVIALCEKIDSIWNEYFSDLSKIPNTYFTPTAVRFYAELSDIVKINSIFDILTCNLSYSYKSLSGLYHEFNGKYKKESNNFSDKYFKDIFRENAQEYIHDDYKNNNRKISALHFEAYDFSVRRRIKPDGNYFIQTHSPLFFTTIIKKWKDIEHLYSSSERLKKFYNYISEDSKLYYPLSNPKSSWRKISYWYLMDRHFAVGLCFKITKAVNKYLEHMDHIEKNFENEFEKHNKEIIKKSFRKEKYKNSALERRDFIDGLLYDATLIFRNKEATKKRLKYFVAYLRTIPGLIVLGRDEFIDSLYREFISGTELNSIVKFLEFTIPAIMTEYHQKVMSYDDLCFEGILSEDLCFEIINHYLDATNIKNKATFTDEINGFEEYDNIKKYFFNQKINDSLAAEYNIWNCHSHI